MNALYQDYDDDRSCSSDDDDNDIRRLYGDELSTTRLTSECTSSSSSLNYNPEKSPQSPHSGHAKPRKSLRDHFVHAMSSPARAARNTLASPGSSGGSSKRRSLTSSSSNNNKNSSQRIKTNSQRLRKDHKSWRAEFDLPAGISREEAVAILICRELEMMDL